MCVLLSLLLLLYICVSDEFVCVCVLWNCCLIFRSRQNQRTVLLRLLWQLMNRLIKKVAASQYNLLVFWVFRVITEWEVELLLCGRASDLWSRGRGFESRPGTRRKNFKQVYHTYVPLSPSSISWYSPKGSDARRLTVGLAESNGSLPPGSWYACVCRCGPGGRWWQPTTGFMTMHAVTCRLTVESPGCCCCCCCYLLSVQWEHRHRWRACAEHEFYGPSTGDDTFKIAIL